MKVIKGMEKILSLSSLLSVVKILRLESVKKDGLK